MLAEKNAEGAKLAATPRLKPIKSGATVPEKRTPGKTAGGDSLSTVPLSVIRQAKVLDIDYLQRKGETIGDLDDVDESELDDAELPDDLPEDMEDAIARMVEEEEQFSAAVAARELPGAEEVLRTTPSKSKQSSKPTPEATPASNPTPVHSASGLQEPHRKRLPMPTMHPPLLRHPFPGHGHPSASLLPPHPMLQRHLSQTVPPPQAMHLLQNALSAPLGQPLGCGNYPTGPGAAQHLPLVMSMPSAAAAAAAAHLMQSSAASAAVRPPETAAGNTAPDSKPRGRRKKVTPLRDQLQKQQTAAAVTAATSSSTPGPVAPEKGKGQPLFKPHEDAAASPPNPQASVITRMPAHLPPPHGRSHGPPGGMYPSSAELARFYSQVASQQPSPGSRSPSSPSGPPRHLLRPQMPPGLPPAHASLRPTYGPPPPLRGSVPPTSTASGGASNSRPPYLHGAEHHGGPPGPPLGGVFGSGPPPARHASSHLNPYRAPPIYGNPNYSPRIGGPPGPGGMRPGSVDYAAGARGYSPYGYYPPPPPLTTPSAHAAPSSVIVSAPPAVTPTNHSVTTLTHGKTLPPAPPTPTAGPPPAAAPPAAIPSEAGSHKPSVTSVITSKKLTTLEAYPIRKSPIAAVGEVTIPAESTSSPAAIAEDDSGSAHDTRAPPSAAGAPAVGEFSGLVSYFSSQQDDYDT
ncbi:uncharacterized protein [Drosophila suzukii]|uniref:Uncharacterized protein n=1 Tax=Drosophila suzukii TaxID=28584 RepID=A0AB40DMF8_DROSZ